MRILIANLFFLSMFSLYSSLLLAEELDYENMAKQMETMNEKGQYNELINTYEKFSKDPLNKNAFFFNEFGVAFIRMKQYEHAISNFQKATLFEPNNSLYWKHLGYSYQKAGQIQLSFTAYKKFAALLPDSDKRKKRVKKWNEFNGDHNKCTKYYKINLENQIKNTTIAFHSCLKFIINYQYETLRYNEIERVNRKNRFDPEISVKNLYWDGKKVGAYYSDRTLKLTTDATNNLTLLIE